MFRQWRKSLSFKIVWVTGLTMVVLLGLSTAWTARDQRNAVVSLEEQTNRRFLMFVKNALHFTMIQGQMAELQAILENAVATVGVESLRLVDAGGVIRYSGRPVEVGAPLENPEVAALVRRGATVENPLGLRTDVGSVNILPLYNQGPCAQCHDAGQGYLGAVVVAFDFSEFDQRISVVRSRQLMVLVISVVVVVGVLFLVLRRMVLSPLFQIVDSAQCMALGDLTRDVEVVGDDEMGRLAQHLNVLRTHLREGVERTTEVAEALALAVEELDRSSQGLVTIAMEQSSGAAQQASAVQEATTTAEEIAATSNEISANVASVEAVAEDTYHASVRGRESVESAMAGMAEVRQQVTGLADAVLGLGKKSSKVGGIVDIIDEISEQTHLLALNAAIEAAGAGEHGKRFGVVAAEIRRLAERTVEATTQIKSLIEEIQDSAHETLLTTEKGTSIVMTGADRVDRIGSSLDEILVRVRQTKESTKEITVATQQQATAGEQLVLTITDINDVAIQVNRSAEQVEKSVMGLKELARRLKDLAHQNLAAREFTV